MRSSAIHIEHTYAGLLEGIPVASMNTRHLSAIPGRLKKILGEAPVFIVPPIYEERELSRSFMGHTSSQIMPRFEIAAQFSSLSTIKEGDGSHLIVCWHQHEVPPMIEDWIKPKILALDWAQHAADFEW